MSITIMRKKIDYKILNDNTLEFIRLGNVFPINEDMNNLSNSFSTRLNQLLNKISNDSVDNMLIDYISNSRLKTLSILAGNLIDEYGISKKITDNYYLPKNRFFSTISNIIESRFYDKWNKIWETFNSEYNPIKPYDMTISESEKEKQGGNTDTSRGYTLEIETNDKQGGETITNKDNNSNYNSNTTDKVIKDETVNKIQGFNSTTFSNSDMTENESENNSNTSSTDENTSTETVKHGLSNDRQQNDSYQGDTKVLHGKTVDTDREISRLGNIGNTSQQDLIDREIELRRYQIYDTIFDDLNSVLTLSKYI